MPDTLPTIRMTPTQAAAALTLAGWPADQIATGVAVGQAESGLNLTAQNPSGADSWLQVLKSAHPDLFSKLPDPYAWVDPVTAAKMGRSVYSAAGNSWHPWTTYTSGKYREYLSEGQKAAEAVQAATAGKSAAEKKAYYTKLFAPLDSSIADVQLLQPVANELGDAATGAAKSTVAAGDAVAGAVSDMASELAAFSDLFQALLLPSTWLRVGSGVLGVLLVVGGLVALGKEAAVSN